MGFCHLASRENRGGGGKFSSPGCFLNNIFTMRILVVENEKKTASFIRKALQAESLVVDVFKATTTRLVVRLPLHKSVDQAT